ncbi:MAG TPA: hypothetical protein VI462_07250 [Acidimicrobiia bacterium]
MRAAALSRPWIEARSTPTTHPATTWPNSQQIVARQFADIPSAERDLICSANAARIYGFD